MHGDLMRVICRIYSSLGKLTHFAAFVTVVFKQTLLGQALSDVCQFYVPCLMIYIQRQPEKGRKKKTERLTTCFQSRVFFNLSKAQHSTQLLLFKKDDDDLTRHSTRKRASTTYHDLHVGSLRLGTRLAPRLLTRSHNRPQCIVSF